jgi:hypothetical protein
MILLFGCFYNGYCAEDSSSGVIVFGSSGASSSETKSSEVISNTTEDSSGSESDEFVPVPLYEISGSRIGSTKVSQEVILPSAAEVMFVDAGISGVFSMVRVEAGGREIQVLNMSPERSVGHKLSKGTYKVYPEDPDGAFTLDKLSAKVQVKLIEGTTGGTQ